MLPSHFKDAVTKKKNENAALYYEKRVLLCIMTVYNTMAHVAVLDINFQINTYHLYFYKLRV